MLRKFSSFVFLNQTLLFRNHKYYILNVKLVVEIKIDVAYSLVTLGGKVYIIYLFILIAFSGSDLVYFGGMKHCSK